MFESRRRLLASPIGRAPQEQTNMTNKQKTTKKKRPRLKTKRNMTEGTLDAGDIFFFTDKEQSCWSVGVCQQKEN